MTKPDRTHLILASVRAVERARALTSAMQFHQSVDQQPSLSVDDQKHQLAAWQEKREAVKA